LSPDNVCFGFRPTLTAFKKVKTMKTLTISLCTAALLTVSAVANAGTIGGASCGSCFGSTYTLTDTPTGAANQYDIF